MIDALRSSAAPPASEVSEGILRSAYEEFARNYDPEWGGFGTGEQFPRASVFNFLLRLHATAPASPEGKAALEMTRNTLHKMAIGGIRDHIGGGFHRYTVDRAWRVPHFEKMLCDQAQLAVTYCEAWQIPAMRPIQGRPALYLCENFTCRAPVTSPEDARRLLDPIPAKSLD